MLNRLLVAAARASSLKLSVFQFCRAFSFSSCFALPFRAKSPMKFSKHLVVPDARRWRSPPISRQ